MRVRLWLIRFKHFRELGVDLVEQKDGIQILLAEFDLDMHWRNALVAYAARHEKHCTEFARAVLERSGRPELLDQSGPSKQDFIEYLETGLVERDLRELFWSG